MPSLRPQSHRVLELSLNTTLSLLVWLLALLLVIGGLPWTQAYFTDQETSFANSFTATTLDADITSLADFVPNVSESQAATKTYTITNTSGTDIKVSLATWSYSANSLCTALDLRVMRDADTLYDGALADLEVTGLMIPQGESLQLGFLATADSLSVAEFGMECDLTIVWQTWQDNIASYMLSTGYTDEDMTTDTITAGQSAVVLNEFLPDPIGDDFAAAPGGEWVELYNNTDAPVDVAGWYLYDDIDDHALPITITNTNTGDTIVPANGFLVVYRDGDADFSLDNTGPETVRLVTGELGGGGVVVDAHTYEGLVPEDKSIARIPDGTGDWVDPVPTPGQPNVLSDDELLEVFEQYVAEHDQGTSEPQNGNGTDDTVLEQLPEDENVPERETEAEKEADDEQLEEEAEAQEEEVVEQELAAEQPQEEVVEAETPDDESVDEQPEEEIVEEPSTPEEQELSEEGITKEIITKELTE